MFRESDTCFLFSMYNEESVLFITDLVCEKGRFIGSIGAGVAAPSERLHVRHSHAQDGELVWFACQCAAGGHHVWQLCDVSGHLISPPPLDLAVILPGVRRSEQEHERWAAHGIVGWREQEQRKVERNQQQANEEEKEKERWMNKQIMTASMCSSNETTLASLHDKQMCMNDLMKAERKSLFKRPEKREG